MTTRLMLAFAAMMVLGIVLTGCNGEGAEYEESGDYEAPPVLHQEHPGVGTSGS